MLEYPVTHENEKNERYRCLSFLLYLGLTGEIVEDHSGKSDIEGMSFSIVGSFHERLAQRRM